MLPVVLAAEVFQVRNQSLSHRFDSVGHEFDFLISNWIAKLHKAKWVVYWDPELLEFLVIQDLISDSGTVEWRVRPKGSGQPLQLGVESIGFIGVSGDSTEATDSFTVKTEVLGVGLRQEDWSLLGEFTNRVGITGEITGGEALAMLVSKKRRFIIKVTWYAISKNGKCFFLRTRSKIWSHCAWDGSTPEIYSIIRAWNPK